MSFRMPDTYYDPPSPTERTVGSFAPCEGDLATPHAPRDLPADLERLAELLDRAAHAPNPPVAVLSEDAHHRAVTLLAAVRAEVADMPAPEEPTECGYEGDIEISVLHGVAQWTCPRCGTENEREVG